MKTDIHKNAETFRQIFSADKLDTSVLDHVLDIDTLLKIAKDGNDSINKNNEIRAHTDVPSYPDPNGKTINSYVCEITIAPILNGNGLGMSWFENSLEDINRDLLSLGLQKVKDLGKIYTVRKHGIDINIIAKYITGGYDKRYESYSIPEIKSKFEEKLKEAIEKSSVKTNSYRRNNMKIQSGYTGTNVSVEYGPYGEEKEFPFYDMKGETVEQIDERIGYYDEVKTAWSSDGESYMILQDHANSEDKIAVLEDDYNKWVEAMNNEDYSKLLGNSHKLIKSSRTQDIFDKAVRKAAELVKFMNEESEYIDTKDESNLDTQKLNKLNEEISQYEIQLKDLPDDFEMGRLYDYMENLLGKDYFSDKRCWSYLYDIVDDIAGNIDWNGYLKSNRRINMKKNIKSGRFIKSGTSNFGSNDDVFGYSFPLVTYIAENYVYDEETDSNTEERDYEADDWDYEDAIDNAKALADEMDIPQYDDYSEPYLCYEPFMIKFRDGYYEGLWIEVKEGTDETPYDENGVYQTDFGEWRQFTEEEMNQYANKLNEYFNQLCSDYGWQKLGVSARFSNGETMYTKINNSRKSIKSGMSYQDALVGFTSMGKPWGDYWEMQQDWTAYIDSLERDGEVDYEEARWWDNPCTPQTFKEWVNE